jgi:hypothetical protein
VQRTPEFDAAPDLSHASADEADMLQILGLSPDTPITRSSDSSPSVELSIPPETVRRIPVTGEIVQREITTDSTSSASIPSPTQLAPNGDPMAPTQQKPSYSASDVEQVAQAVYKSLRNRLRIERERSRGRVE